MHAGLPLRSIIPTIDAPVLMVLAGTTRPLSGRRVAALAGASHPAVGAVLAPTGGGGHRHCDPAGAVRPVRRQPRPPRLAGDRNPHPAARSLRDLTRATFGFNV
jgi:hypothetical protein